MPHPIPLGQKWLTTRMQALKYKPDSAGVCQGFCGMGMQAILADDLATFNKRNHLINSIPVEKFKSKVDAIIQRHAAIFQELREKIIQAKEFTSKEKEELENDNKVKKKIEKLIFAINALIKEGKLEEDKAADEFEKRKESLLFNAFVQKKWHEKFQQFPLDERIISEMYNFFDGIELFHQPPLYPDCFEKTATLKTQDIMFSLPLTAPLMLETEGIDISQVGSFSGVYSHGELINCLGLLQQIINQANPPVTKPVTLALGSGNHEMTIGYHPVKKEWYFVDINQAEEINRSFTSVDELARKVIGGFSSGLLGGFSNNQIAIFTTKVFCNKSDEETLRKCMVKLKEDEEWTKIHDVTPEKATLTDPANITWLYVAAQCGDFDTIKKLIEAGAELNYQNGRGGNTALGIASQNGHHEVVHALIEAKAEVDQQDFRGRTPLWLASQNGHLAILKELLKEKVDLNHSDKWGDTPFYAASYHGHYEVVKELIEAGARLDCPNNKDKRPLWIAAQNGHFNIVRELLKNGANAGLTSTLKRDPLLSDTNTKLKALAYKKRQNDSPNITVTPMEIPDAKGHVEIASLIKYHLELQQPLANTPRIKAIRHYYDKCFAIENESQIKDILKNFHDFDEIAQSLSNIQYRSVTLFHGENKEREAKINDIKTLVDEAYRS